jgi:hypothetical protein
MAAIFGLVEITFGLANTAEMIAGAAIRAQIKNYIDEHREELELLKEIDGILKNTFDNKVLNNELSQLGIVSEKIFNMIGSNMADLSNLGQ